MRTAPGTVLFATAGFRRKPQADGTRIVGVLGDLVGGSLMALAVPHRLPGVGVHIAHLLEITGPPKIGETFRF